MLKTQMDINADIGEGFGPYKVGDDHKLMSYVKSVNIACGFHAGDYKIMDETVKLALKKGLKVGAHPGYPDRYGFGRRAMSFNHDEIRAQLLYQIGALEAMATYHGGKLHHVKLHGALYNKAATDLDLSMMIVETIKKINPQLILYSLSGSAMVKAAKTLGLSVKNEVFADRRYDDAGQLLSRSIEGSVLEEKEAVLNQVKSIVEKGLVITNSGKSYNLKGDTICVHGDTPKSLELAKAIYGYLGD